MDVAPTAVRTGSAVPIPADLRRAGVIGRFPPETETSYRVWLVEQVRPLLRVTAGLSIPFWIAIPFMIEVWVDSPVKDEIYVLSFAVNVPVLVVGLLLTASRWTRVQMPIASATVLAIGVTTFYLSYHVLTVPSEAGLLGSIIWFNMLPLFLRTPFWTTIVMTVIITATGASFLVASVHEQHTPRAESWSYILLIAVDVVMVPAMALVSERAMRQHFVDEQVIARQGAELVASRALLRRYAPPAVANRIEQGDHTVDTAQRRRVTLFFADVVGFTTLADRLDPEALAEIVNEYLGSVAQIIETRGGTLNEFAGDGVMAIFGAPEEMEPRDQVVAALDAARELQRSLPEWSRRWYPLGIDQDLQARIGINTGVISVGTFGSAVRATYTGIGLQTNIAARIQAQCPPGSVLLSKTSWHLVSEAVRCEPRGEVAVKGVHYPIAMYEPESLAVAQEP